MLLDDVKQLKGEMKVRMITPFSSPVANFLLLFSPFRGLNQLVFSKVKLKHVQVGLEGQQKCDLSK